MWSEQNPENVSAPSPAPLRGRVLETLNSPGWWDRLCFFLLLVCVVSALLFTGRYMPSPLNTHNPTYPKYFVVQTLAMLMAFCLIWRIFILRRLPEGMEPLNPRRLLFPVLLGLYGLWNALSLAWSFWHYGALRYVVREGLFFFLAFCACLTLWNRKRWLVCAAVYIMSATVAVVWQGHHILREYALVSGQYPFSRVIEIFFRRPFLFGNANFSVSIIFTAVILAFGFCLRHTFYAKDTGRLRMRKILSWVFFAIMAPASAFLIYAADSRAGYLGMAVGVIGYAICIFPVPRRRLVVGVLAMLALASGVGLLAHPRTGERIISGFYGAETTLQARGIWWVGAVDMALDRPLTGHGPAGYTALYYEYEPPLGRRSRFTRQHIATHPHNEFLRIWAELGLIGAALYGLLLAAAFAAAYTAVRDGPPAFRPIGFGFWAAGLAFVTQIAFGIAALHIDFALPYWLLLGLLASAAYWRREGAEPAASGEGEAEGAAAGNPGLSKRFLQILAVVLILLAGWYWWQWGVKSYGSQVGLARLQGAIPILTRLGEEGLQEGDKHRAEAVAEHAEELMRDNMPALLIPQEKLRSNIAIARALMRCGLYEDALRHLERVQDAAPGMTYVEGYLGLSYLHTGRHERAGYYLGKYLEKYPDLTHYYPYLWEVDREAATRLLYYQVFYEDVFSNPERVGMLARFYETLGWLDALGLLAESVEEAGQEASLEAIIRLLASMRQAALSDGREEELQELKSRHPELFELMPQN